MSYGPTELIKIGADPSRFKKATTDEYHGPCVYCGGHDRMVVFTDKQFPHWNWFCRQCTPDGGWIDEINPNLKEKLSPAEVMERAKEEAERAKDRLRKEIERAERAMRELQDAQNWVKYYEGMGAKGKQLWEQRGVPIDYQNLWMLGYCEDYSLWRKYNGQWEDWWHTPTLSIPIRTPDWEVANIKHRLLNVPTNGGKYRYEKNGIPASPFICSPDHDKGPLFIAEGEVKSMVVYATMNEDPYDSIKMQVTGLPSAKPDKNVLELFKDYEPVYLCLDPGVDTSDIAHALDPERVRLIELPDKVDDLIVDYELDKYWLEALMRTAKRVAK